MTDTQQLTSIFQDTDLANFQVKFNQQIAVAMGWARPAGSPMKTPISAGAEFLNAVERAQLAQISEFYATLRLRYDELMGLVNSGATDRLSSLYMLHGVIAGVEYIHAIEIGKHGVPVTPENVPESPAPKAKEEYFDHAVASNDSSDSVLEEDEDPESEPEEDDDEDSEDDDNEEPEPEDDDEDAATEPEPVEPKKEKKPKKPKKA